MLVSFIPPVVRLRAELPAATFIGCDDLLAWDVTDQAGAVRPRALFAALPGSRCHGREFAFEAMQRGAAGILTDASLPDVAAPQVVVSNARAAYAQLCAALFGQPTTSMRIAGITGTNGKTTVAWMVRHLLASAGVPCGLLGTVEYFDGAASAPASLTTPDSRTMQSWFARMAARRVNHAAIELSSHALDQDRAAGVSCDAVVCTNVTQDHFDYHAGFEKYLAAKQRIVSLLAPGGRIVLNSDDSSADSFRRRAPRDSDVVSCSLSKEADYRAQLLTESRRGTEFLLSTPAGTCRCRMPLLARHNVFNALLASAIVERWNLSLDAVVAGLRSFRGAPGRLERIDSSSDVDVLVDYAHTDDALRRCLIALRNISPGRLLCVFGAGGDRDRTKRPLMGQAAQLADVAIVTSDNPRTESPGEILRDIVMGMSVASSGQLHVEPDRRAAIAWAVDAALPGDIVLIAGKGHETVQIIGANSTPFDDRQIARECLERRRLRLTMQSPPWPESRRSA